MTRFSIDFFRRRLASVDALPQLALLAVIAGLLTGAVTLTFRALIELILRQTLPGGISENFEGLPVEVRVALPIAGAFAIGLGLQWLSPSERRVGVVHVMERLSRHQGHLPWRGALTQFFGGIVALVTGQSGGREGPAVHLGAATSSLLGQVFKLPNNSIRTLVGCGTAAAIAASFNTPIAGVIFAMEVVMMDYTIASFTPVIIAAVSATVLSRFAYGSDVAFTVPPLTMESLLDLPSVLVEGLLIGALAAAFIVVVQLFARLSNTPIWLRALLAGGITAAVAFYAPAVMGIGYDTVNSAMVGELALVTLGIVAVAKLLTTAATVGLGLPVGLIGPTLVIGATFGGLFGVISNALLPDHTASPGFYVLLGMSAMMAAVLQAPLAALMTVLELTGNPGIILPAMLVIVAATLTTSEVFRQRSMFLTTLRTLGLQYPPDPVSLHLQRAAVASLMERDFKRLGDVVLASDAREALVNDPRWVIVESGDGELLCVMNASDLGAFVEERFPDQDEAEIELMRVPGMRKDVASIDIQATLAEAVERLEKTGVEALCVTRTTAPMITPVVGVLTRAHIDEYSRVN
jgi:CIC family chloride channel protein